MLIITHHTGEPHSLLGPQVAATYITRRLHMPCTVVGVTRNFNREKLLEFINGHYGAGERIICFSHLCGRKDLIDLIGVLKGEGFRTILGGPQAVQDYLGEEDTVRYPLRFPGLQDSVDMAFSGPVDRLTEEHVVEARGPIRFSWGHDLFLEIDWENLSVFSDGLTRLWPNVVQVLRGIGCPHARKSTAVVLDNPAFLPEKGGVFSVNAMGCTFCDVACDKGFHGYVSRSAVMEQIRRLPEKDGAKMPFEFIDEYPIKFLSILLEDLCREGTKISQVNLVCRVDDITLHRDILEKVLGEAERINVKIMFSSIGFESFSDKILRNFNKGITVDEIVRCVRILREMKRKFGDTLLYTRDEGAVHGFIHPTPWDDTETSLEMNKNIAVYGLFQDVLPPHSVPLIIHHGSWLGGWIRDIEAATDIRFRRDATWIEWWSPITTGVNEPNRHSRTKE